MSTTPENYTQDTAMHLKPRELTLIVAATNSMGIGVNGALPWKGLKKEMAYFARVTKRAAPGIQNTVIMGRKTWDSIPPKFRPLKDRLNIVVSRSSPSSSTDSSEIIVPSLEKALAEASPEGRIFVIGGSQIYEAALQLKEAKRILLTKIQSEFECDAFFPVELKDGAEGEGWERRSRKELNEWVGEEVPGDEEGVVEEGGTKYVFEMWEKR